MTKNIIQHIENTDSHILEYVYQHPTLNNIEHAIDIITNVGVNSITSLSK